MTRYADRPKPRFVAWHDSAIERRATIPRFCQFVKGYKQKRPILLGFLYTLTKPFSLGRVPKERPLWRLGTAVIAPPPREDSPGQAARTGVFLLKTPPSRVVFSLEFLVNQLMTAAGSLGFQQHISNPE